MGLYGIVTLLGAGEPREVRVASVSDGLFGLLGMPVVLGRGFLPEENKLGQNTVAVLDDGFWQRAFGGDHSGIGRTVSVGGASYTIVGVLAQGARLPADVPGARLPSEADVYLPIEYGEAFSASTATECPRGGPSGESFSLILAAWAFPVHPLLRSLPEVRAFGSKDDALLSVAPYERAYNGREKNERASYAQVPDWRVERIRGPRPSFMALVSADHGWGTADREWNSGDLFVVVNCPAYSPQPSRPIHFL